MSGLAAKGLRLHGATGKFTWRMLATVLFSQSIVVFFGALVARGMATVEHGASRGTAYLAVGSGLAVLCLVAAGVVKRPWGLTLGWVVQVLTLLSGFVVPTMVIVGLLFLALWLICLVQGHRVDALQRRWAAQAETRAGEAGSEAATPTDPPVPPGSRTAGN